MEAQRRFQELMQWDVQRTTSMTTCRDQELVEENSKRKVEIALKEAALGQRVSSGSDRR